MTQIRDPSSEKGANVNSEGRLETQSHNHTEARHHAGEGDVYLIGSGFGVGPATADDFTNILYVRNDSTTKEINIGILRTCNEVAGKWRLLKNPTALGTSVITPVNSNLGSSKTLVATVQEFSVAGTTFTDGTVMGQWIHGVGHSLFPFQGSVILGPNDAIGLEYAPHSATAGEACATIQCWQIDE